MSSERQKRVALQVKLTLCLGAVLALVGVGCGTGGPLDAKALVQQSGSLQSVAAEGALLAQDAASGKTTRIYTQVHSSELFRAASQAEATLKLAETGPALAPQLRLLSVLAGRVSADLERLPSASNDEARMLTGDLEAAARACQKIGESLT